MKPQTCVGETTKYARPRGLRPRCHVSSNKFSGDTRKVLLVCRLRHICFSCGSARRLTDELILVPRACPRLTALGQSLDGIYRIWEAWKGIYDFS